MDHHTDGIRLVRKEQEQDEQNSGDLSKTGTLHRVGHECREDSMTSQSHCEVFKCPVVRCIPEHPL